MLQVRAVTIPSLERPHSYYHRESSRFLQYFYSVGCLRRVAQWKCCPMKRVIGIFNERTVLVGELTAKRNSGYNRTEAELWNFTNV
jgi:hypothetical protein